MGQPKAWIAWGEQTLLQRVVAVVRQVTDRQIVVAAPGQQLPALPPDVPVALDHVPGRGPLEGLRAGLEFLVRMSPDTDACFVTSCDVPLLRPALVESLFGRLQSDVDIVIPRDSRYMQPLCAVYRPSTVLPVVRQLLGEDRLRPMFLVQACRSRIVPIAELRDVDPQLESFENVNTPEQLSAARERGKGQH